MLCSPNKTFAKKQKIRGSHHFSALFKKHTYETDLIHSDDKGQTR
jgi:hypothetical protein